MEWGIALSFNGKAPERLQTDRLILQKPTLSDADAIFTRYASDPEVTKYLAWRRHESIEDTNDFLQFSDTEWVRWPAGPYMIKSRFTGTLLGSTGFTFECPTIASTGYALARDAWGCGYATEALSGVVAVAKTLGVVRLYAYCHPQNAASIRVLEKCSFALERRFTKLSAFPNLRPETQEHCLVYVFSGELPIESEE